ncbi:MAG TPA: stage V sporulation protein AA [Candidatus Egerieimonas intestinavium]|uniref:Stage V sporulation protein AA n=1 Tax=Candidatus Egerieimonas intestinavium TaxID=2840777 RepID=A0A9D1EI92_9FIRM|nr:stage V sporulation protein AA [Candidatus Egerieimonas intestinavium]
MSDTLYLATEKNVKVGSEAVALGDIAKLSCSNPRVLAKAQTLKVMQIPKGQYGRYVVTAISLVVLVQKHLEQVEVTHMGEPEFLITFEKPSPGSRLWPWIKTALVCLVTFFGSAFSIMTFNTDVDVAGLFDHIYQQFTGNPEKGFTILEIAYSVGIGLGVVFFFNHFGPRKLTQDPTPMEVEMRVYEDQVNTTLIDQEDRGQPQGGGKQP